jgi:hypothetical protein
LLRCVTAVGEVGHEQRFARNEAGAHLHEFAQETAGGLRTVAHLGFELDAIFHVEHGARLGNHRFVGVQFDLHDLNVLTNDLVVYFV